MVDQLAKLLGSSARLKTIRLFVFNKESSLTISDIALRTKLSKDVVRRELTDLVASDFVRKKSTGSSVSYQTNPRFEQLDALDSFVRDTTSIRPKSMIGVLKRAGTLKLVVLSGIFTSVLESQIDLLIVGDNLSERVLTTVVRSLEAELGREIRYASFSTADFRYRLGVYDRLLRDVFDYPHRLLVDKIGL